MPHKRNPITGERLSGLARVVRGNAVAALENVALWHERDISHSSAERIILPDSCTLLDYMLVKLRELVERLQVYPENMERNLGLTKGLYFSQSILLALTRAGARTEDRLRSRATRRDENLARRANFRRECESRNRKSPHCFPPNKSTSFVRSTSISATSTKPFARSACRSFHWRSSAQRKERKLRGAQAAGLSVVGWLGRRLSRSELPAAFS